jgi:hypothetical protein
MRKRHNTSEHHDLHVVFSCNACALVRQGLQLSRRFSGGWVQDMCLRLRNGAKSWPSAYHKLEQNYQLSVSLSVFLSFCGVVCLSVCLSLKRRCDLSTHALILPRSIQGNEPVEGQPCEQQSTDSNNRSTTFILKNCKT